MPGSATTEPNGDDAPAFAAGDRLGNYRLLPESEGASGDLMSWRTEGASFGFVAEHVVLGRKAVIVVPKGKASSQERFQRWLHLQSRLDHPNILKVHDCGQHGSTPYAVLQHIDGPMLENSQGNGPVRDLLTVLRLFRTIANALAHCHGRDVVHRDVKHTNIRLDHSGTPFLTGFLIAADLRLDDGGDVRGGTPGLVAPEAWETMVPRNDEVVPPRRAYGTPVDVWAFGLTLLEALTGVAPYAARQGDDPLGVRASIQSAEPVDLSSLREAVPEPVVEFVSRCVAKDPDERYRDGSEMERAIDALLDHFERTDEALDATIPIVGRSLLLFTEPLASDEIGRYREVDVLEHMGAGAFANVYRVTDWARETEWLALKVLRADHLSNEVAVARFRREARYLSRLASSEVVRLRGFGRLGSTFFIAMDFIDGKSLDELIRSEAPLDVARTSRIVAQVAAGLAAIHDAGVVHRDLKPANVVLTRAGHAVIADFGLAHGLDASRLTSEGVFCGTPSYAAPESLLGGKPTPAGDVFALGVILYELLSGALPHQADTPHARILAILEHPPRPLDELQPGLPPGLVELTMSCLHKEGDRRPSVTEVRAVLGS